MQAGSNSHSHHRAREATPVQPKSSEFQFIILTWFFADNRYFF